LPGPPGSVAEFPGRLLDNLRRAIPAGARLLGVEHLVPEGARQASGKLTDVNMMVIAGGRERTEAEYRRLFAAHGFRPTRVVPTRGRLVWDRGLAGLKA
jgi:hypothetical protein